MTEYNYTYIYIYISHRVYKPTSLEISIYGIYKPTNITGGLHCRAMLSGNFRGTFWEQLQWLFFLCIELSWVIFWVGDVQRNAGGSKNKLALTQGNLPRENIRIVRFGLMPNCCWLHSSKGNRRCTETLKPMCSWLHSDTRSHAILGGHLSWETHGK